MADPFSDLYDQILACERRVHERKHILKTVKAQIQGCKEDLARAMKDEELLRADLASNTQKLAEMENNKRDMDARHKILSSQKCALLEEKCKLQELLDSMQAQHEEKMILFCETVENVKGELDLTRSRECIMERQLHNKLRHLIEQEKFLLKDIEEYESHRRDTAELEAEKHMINQNLRDLLQNKKELEECLKTENEAVEHLEEVRRALTRLPTQSLEFTSLQAELTSLNTDTLEDQCSKLKQKLQQLQQQLQARRLQQQQQQQRQCAQILPMQPDNTQTHDQVLDSFGNFHCVTSIPKSVRIRQMPDTFGDSATEVLSRPDLLPHHGDEVNDDIVPMPENLRQKRFFRL